MTEALEVAGVEVQPGTRRRFEIPVARFPTGTQAGIPVVAVHGAEPGPTVWVSAAVHGDEVNGVEIIRRVLTGLDARELAGSVLAVPIVNVFGFIQHSRYLPDRRDLNRCFPGSPRGSLASRLAHIFMREIVARSSLGIDLHTASNHRTNLPQVRADLSDPHTRRLAEAFAADVMMHSRTRDGSLRAAATRRGIPVLLYEAGEPQRFNPEAIDAGVTGVCRLLRALGMLRTAPPPIRPSVEIERSAWIRARRSGILRLTAGLGDPVQKGDELGAIADAFGEEHATVRAPSDGLVIGHTNNPLVSQGDGIVHVGRPASG